MSNSPGRQRTGYPPQGAHPDGRQPDTNDPRYAQQHEQPALSWPPQAHEQQQNWWQGGHPAEGGYAEGQNRPAPQQNNSGQYPPAQPGYHDPNAPLPAGYGQAQPPVDPYRHPNEPGAVAEDPYSQPTLGVPDHQGYGGYPGQPARPSPYAAQFEAYTQPNAHADPNMGQPGFGADYGQPQDDPQLRGGAYDDNWPPAAPPLQARLGQAEHQNYPQEPGLPGGVEQWADPAYPQLDGGYPTGGPYAGAALREPAPTWPQGNPVDQYGYPNDPHGQSIDPGLVAQAQHIAVNDGYEEYDEEDEADDRPRSGRSLFFKVVGALVGAIVIGAGLTYGYKNFIAGGMKLSAAPPVIRGDGKANKARPSDPGGRKFDHTNSKIMQRMSDNGRGSASTGGNGARRVSTMMIDRNGRVVDTGQPTLPSSATPGQPVVSVPGLTVVDGFAAQRAATKPQQPSAGGPIVVTPPKTAGSSLSPVRPAVVKKEPSAAPVVEPPPRAPTTKVANVAPPKSPSPAPKAKPKPKPKTSAPAVSSPSGNGYVAVLASVPVSGTSRLEALKTFADIQQSYGKVLGNRTPDVREADLGAKGRYHRLMVGPPASRESASALCKELKSAGYPSCWITAY